MDLTLEDRIQALEELVPIALANGHLSAEDLSDFAAKWRIKLDERAAVTLHPSLLYPTSDEALGQIAKLLEEASEIRRQLLRGPGV